MSSVLFVITAADRWTLKDGSTHPTGYWGEEVAEPHRIFTEAGWDITIATPGGVPPTLDQGSVKIPTKVNRRARKYLEQISAELEAPRRLDEVDHADHDVVFYPGGHGPMEDLAYDETSGALLADRLASGRPLALLCHAPAAILAAQNPDGTSPFTGYRLTGLTNLEERTNPASWKAKWLLEDRLREIGTDYRHGRIPLRTFVVRDRNLYTGQNPASSAHLAQRVITDHSAAAA